MNEFRDALSRFRKELDVEANGSPRKEFRAMLERDRSAKNLRLRWVAASAMALVLGAIPVYQKQQQRHREADEAQAQADAQLLRQVNAGLSRPVARAMTVLMDGIPGN